MRDYGIVSPKFWTGDTGKQLRKDAQCQVLALYLMTSPHATMIGVYYCPIMYMAHETGLGMEGATKALARLIEMGFCTFDEASETVFVTNMAAYQIAEQLKPDDKRVLGIRREVDKMPAGEIKAAFLATYSGAFHLADEVKKGRGSQGASKTLPSQKQDQDQKQDQEGSSAALQSTEPPSGFAIPLIDGTEHEVALSALTEWRAAFPAVDVEQELREMRAWCNANKENRKTSRGVDRFIVRWLQKAQDTPNRNRKPAADDWTRSAA